MYSDGVRPWWRILVSQVVSLSDLMEMAADSRKDNNFVEMNASYTVVNSYPLCHWCSFLHDLIDLPPLAVPCDLNTDLERAHTPRR